MAPVDSKRIQLAFPRTRCASMTDPKPQDCYTEQEAAAFLGISVTRLHMLLDDNVFNDGSLRPNNLTFRPCDLVLLGFWHRNTPNPKVVRMPRRNWCA